MIDSCSQCACVWLDHGELSTLERTAGRSAPQPMTNLPPIAVPMAAREQSSLETFFDMLFC
jgi:Zn-finger nucleic acid-binding protein